MRGVTLIELVVVMSLLGILAAVAAIALREPVEAYRDANRRAELTDMTDTALRRMARDIRLALPNSVRTSGNYLELLPTVTGGRYRAEQSGTGTGDMLDFAAPDTSFDVLGDPHSASAGQIVVVFNLWGAPGVHTSNAYTYGSADCAAADSPGCNTALITSVGGGKIQIAARRFAQPSPGNRFHVIAPNAVSYECNPGAPNAQGDATGTLTRISGYGIQLAQPTGSGFGTRTLLAQYVESCTFTYDPLVLTQSLGLVTLTLKLTRGGESVSLYHEVHVPNIP